MQDKELRANATRLGNHGYGLLRYGRDFRTSSERQPTEKQFEDLLQLAEKDGSGRNWDHIRETLSACVYEEQRPALNGTATVSRDGRLMSDSQHERTVVHGSFRDPLRKRIWTVVGSKEFGAKHRSTG